MRHLKLPLGLVATACAFAVAASPAMAHEFTSSVSGRTHGKTESAQKFRLGPFKITCLKAISKGSTLAGSSQTFTTTVKYSKCHTYAQFSGKSSEFEVGTVFKTPLVYEYHANGFVETGSETEEVEGKVKLSGGEAELKLNAGPKFKCNVRIPEQTFPIKAIKRPELEYSAATYSNESHAKTVSKKFPDGLQHTILITNEFKSVHSEFEGEPCEEFGRNAEAESINGLLEGSFPEELTGGNLEFH